MRTDADPRAHEPRPLPAHPNLEFERKRAKKLLREMRRTNPDAKLTQAQFAIAREYGFRGWPLLVQYFQELERQERYGRGREGLPQSHADSMAESILRQHANRRSLAALSLAAWVPRFYGRSPEDALDSPITLEDARLVAARQFGAPSWEALLAAGVKAKAESDTQQWQPRPAFHRASEAVLAQDLDALRDVCERHPEALGGPEQGRSLLQSAIRSE